MKNCNHKRTLRWLVPVVLIVLMVALGWQIGRRAGAGPVQADAAAASAADETYPDVAGRVVRLAPDKATMTVAHEEIEGFMQAMVMDLKVADPDELQGLGPNDAILFDLAMVDGVYKMTRIRRADPQAPGATGSVEPLADPLERGDFVPDLLLTDSQGRTFKLRGMQPRHKLVTFFYARCPLKNFCPAQSARLAQLQEHLKETGSSVHLVSLTLDAEHDGPDVLAAYAKQFNADPARWTLAGSSDPAAVRDFANRAGAHIRKHTQGFQIDHALVALRVDGDRIVDVVYGLDSIEEMGQKI